MGTEGNFAVPERAVSEAGIEDLEAHAELLTGGGEVIGQKRPPEPFDLAHPPSIRNAVQRLLGPEPDLQGHSVKNALRKAQLRPHPAVPVQMAEFRQVGGLFGAAPGLDFTTI